MGTTPRAPDGSTPRPGHGPFEVHSDPRRAKCAVSTSKLIPLPLSRAVASPVCRRGQHGGQRGGGTSQTAPQGCVRLPGGWGGRDLKALSTCLCNAGRTGARGPSQAAIQSRSFLLHHSSWDRKARTGILSFFTGDPGPLCPPLPCFVLGCTSHFPPQALNPRRSRVINADTAGPVPPTGNTVPRDSTQSWGCRPHPDGV